MQNARIDSPEKKTNNLPTYPSPQSANVTVIDELLGGLSSDTIERIVECQNGRRLLRGRDPIGARGIKLPLTLAA